MGGPVETRGVTYGGRLKDIPKPWIMYSAWKPSWRRRIEVRSTVWYGWGVHHHANIKEEDDRIWHEGEWTIPWHEEPESPLFKEYQRVIQGRVERKVFNFRAEVEAWASSVLASWGIDGERYEVDWDLGEDVQEGVSGNSGRLST